MSIHNLRDYQQELIQQVNAAWSAGSRYVGLQLATGGGKTIVFCSILKSRNVPTITIAHRAELVTQLSLTLARNAVYHDVIAAKDTIRSAVSLHMSDLGRSFYRPGSQVMVSGIDTLLRVKDSRFERVKLLIVDEAHHVLKDNKWGRAVDMFPNAIGLLPTATPLRADGKGLGSHADGLIDTLVTGPSGRDLINAGHLTDYRIFAPPSDLDLSSVNLSASGDFSPAPLRDAVHKSRIMGDVVSHYLKIAPGKLGLTFATDIESAGELAAEYRKYNVAAEVITGKTPPALRASLMRRFRNREILQLVNVDVLGEGVDVPALEVVSFARPTCSFSLYAQQFGRALRPYGDKQHAIIIDHVGNVHRHGLPDAPRTWSLDRRVGKSRGTQDDVIPVRTCGNASCLSVYERTRKACPYCGFYTEPASRSSPEAVDGDLTELNPDVLAQLRGEVLRIEGPARVPQNLDAIAQKAVINRHRTRQDAQALLKHSIALWAGYYRDLGRDDSEIYRLFFYQFHTDILTAQTLNASSAFTLLLKINNFLTINGIVNKLSSSINTEI